MSRYDLAAGQGAMVENVKAGRGSASSVKFGPYRMPLPRSRMLRVAVGTALVVFGIFGFLPVVGFWMIPAGLLVLSVDLPRVRRWRRRFALWFARKYPGTAARLHVSANGHANNAKRRGGSTN